MLEHQAKTLLDSFGLPIPRGVVCAAPEEVAAVYDTLGADQVAIKAQVPIGRRGKAGGIRFAASREEAATVAAQLFELEIGGFAVQELLVEEKLALQSEFYLSVLTDTSAGASCPRVMLSSRGGMDIEELAVEAPGSIVSCFVDPCYGLHAFQARHLLRSARVPADLMTPLAGVLLAAYRAYWESDAELVEVNPLGVLADGRVFVMDGKITIDNSALYRHPGLRGAVVDSVEGHATAVGLSYVPLDGNIGIMSNGAGLTMATMDQLALIGGRPANFMDTGERILRDGIPDGFDILFANPQVTVVLLNVFGGGVRCDVIAQKVIEALERRPGEHVPIVVCLNGRNSDIGRRALEERALPFVLVAHAIDEALREAVRLGAAA